MKIVAIKIGHHWYRSASALPVMAEFFPLFSVSRMRNETYHKMVQTHGFNDLYKYSHYNMNDRKFHNLIKRENGK